MSEWYSLAEASRVLGKEKTYVSQWVRSHPDDIPADMIKTISGTNVKLISESGLEIIKNKPRKKESVRVRNSSSHKDYLEGQFPSVTLLYSILNGMRAKFYCFS